MKYNTRAIALTYIKQGESSIISKLFTEEKGLQAFIIKGARSKKSKKKTSYFEPLKLLNLNATFNSKKSLHYLQDVEISIIFKNTVNKMQKNFIAFFIAEVISRVLQENEQNSKLFDFLWDKTITLYSKETLDPNFAIKFLLDLSLFLGFYPSKKQIQKPFFNLQNGGFSSRMTVPENCLDNEQSGVLKALLLNKNILIPKEKKSELLKKLLYYYKLQNYNLDNITSHLIIEALRV